MKRGSDETMNIRYYCASIRTIWKDCKRCHPDIDIGLSSFCKTKPRHIRRLKITNRATCLCMHHTNARLYLKALSQHKSKFAAVSASNPQAKEGEKDEGLEETCDEEIDPGESSSELDGHATGEKYSATTQSCHIDQASTMSLELYQQHVEVSETARYHNMQSEYMPLNVSICIQHPMLGWTVLADRGSVRVAFVITNHCQFHISIG